MRLDFNETKQKSKWSKLGCAAVQLLGLHFLNYLYGSIPSLEERRKIAEGSIQDASLFLGM